MIATLLLAGCSLPTSGGDLPTCRPEELLSPPTIRFPVDSQVIDTLSPTFAWDWGEACNPQQFLIEVFSPSSALPAMVSERVPGDTRAWDMDGALQPGRTYTWRLTPRTMGSTGPVSSTHFFLTGPICADVSAADYPAPILLSPPDGTEITEAAPIHTSDGTEYPSVSFYMVWDDPARCHPGGYRIQVSASPTFPESRTLEFPHDNRTVELFFFPPGLPERLAMHDCTRYYWHVAAALPDEEYGPYSETWSFFINTGSVPCLSRPVVTPVLPVGPPPAATAPPTETTAPVAPLARALQNTNCRFGPSPAFAIESTLFEGQSAAIEGRNEESTWWLVRDPLGVGSCWVWARAVEVTGDPNGVPVAESPPTPTPTKTPKPLQPALQGCWVFNQNTQKNVCVVPCPPKPQPGGACSP